MFSKSLAMQNFLNLVKAADILLSQPAGNFAL